MKTQSRVMGRANKGKRQIKYGLFDPIRLLRAFLLCTGQGGRERFYTSAVWDLVDDLDRRATFGGLRPRDRANGFTMPQIESNMRGVRSWNTLRNNVLSRGRQGAEVTELFAHWN